MDTDSIGNVICRKAVEVDAVAVVMASHTRSKLTEFVLGSVTNYCTCAPHALWSQVPISYKGVLVDAVVSWAATPAASSSNLELNRKPLSVRMPRLVREAPFVGAKAG